MSNFSMLGYAAETIQNDETEYKSISTCWLGVTV